MPETPKEDFIRFSNWVDNMSDTEFELFLENEASSKQKDFLFGQIREEIDGNELDENDKIEILEVFKNMVIFRGQRYYAR